MGYRAMRSGISYLFRARHIAALHAQHQWAIGRQFAVYGFGVVGALPVSKLFEAVAVAKRRGYSKAHTGARRAVTMPLQDSSTQ